MELSKIYDSVIICKKILRGNWKKWKVGVYIRDKIIKITFDDEIKKLGDYTKTLSQLFEEKLSKIINHENKTKCILSDLAKLKDELNNICMIILNTKMSIINFCEEIYIPIFLLNNVLCAIL